MSTGRASLPPIPLLSIRKLRVLVTHLNPTDPSTNDFLAPSYPFQLDFVLRGATSLLLANFMNVETLVVLEI